MPDLFISYSRIDKEFVRRLTRALTDRKYDVWVDFEDIPFATDWWDEICGGIESANTVLLILSPDFLESEYCGLEVNHVLKHKKRFVPVLYRATGERPVPAHISHIQWIDFSQPEGFDSALSQLVTTISTDLEAARRHTALLVRAREWEDNGHSPNLLLRGEQLDEAEQLQTGGTLTALQQSYLKASRQHDLRWQMARRFGLAFLGGLLAIAFWAFSTFRSDTLFTSARLLYTIALGQTFGLCLGLMAVLAGDLPEAFQRWLPERAAGRIALCLALGVLAWGSYHWFLDNLDTTPQDINALLLGGVGLAGGFIARILFAMPGWLFAALVAGLTYIPIFITLDRYLANTGQFIPLIFFDDRSQVFSVAIPMVALIAVGATAPPLYREARKLIARKNQ